MGWVFYVSLLNGMLAAVSTGVSLWLFFVGHENVRRRAFWLMVVGAGVIVANGLIIGELAGK